MSDFLDTLAQDAKRTVESGYYQTEAVEHKICSLKENIVKCERNPIIAEIKLSSPSKTIVRGGVNVVDVASSMRKGGCIGISILTEPKHFKGSLNDFKKIREKTSIPLLMKDFVIDKVQVEAASKIGADAILLIQALFDRNYCNSGLCEMIEYAHCHKIEVLLEAHSEDEFQRAVGTDADLIGINNRDLKTLAIDLCTTEQILMKHHGRSQIIVSESGIESAQQIRFLRGAGAKAFLVGTAIMSAHNIEEKVRELVEA